MSYTTVDLKKAQSELKRMERWNKELHDRIVSLKLVHAERQQQIEALKDVISEMTNPLVLDNKKPAPK
jgi:hypothetical protein